mmetsp:Transcript_16047/g.41200  ORF Transcript_16047/g.41200 Transcript_16047/m.41200 type:complete len:205 (-) Transcript_16047:2104-2718(-)
MLYQTVDHRVVTAEHSFQCASLLVPDENTTTVRSAHHVLAVGAEKVAALDGARGVVPAVLSLVGLPQCAGSFVGGKAEIIAQIHRKVQFVFLSAAAASSCAGFFFVVVVRVVVLLRVFSFFVEPVLILVGILRLAATAATTAHSAVVSVTTRLFTTCGDPSAQRRASMSSVGLFLLNAESPSFTCTLTLILTLTVLCTVTVVTR